MNQISSKKFRKIILHKITVGNYWDHILYRVTISKKRIERRIVSEQAIKHTRKTYAKKD